MEDKSCKTPRWRMFKARLNNLKPVAAQQFIETNTDIVLIDVRKPSEFIGGHLAGAINMDYFGADFYDQLEALDPSRTYLIYCRSGRRSIRACTLMINGGMPSGQVFNLDGGIQTWDAVLQLH